MQAEIDLSRLSCGFMLRHIHDRWRFISVFLGKTWIWQTCRLSALIVSTEAVYYQKFVNEKKILLRLFCVAQCKRSKLMVAYLAEIERETR